MLFRSEMFTQKFCSEFFDIPKCFFPIGESICTHVLKRISIKDFDHSLVSTYSLFFYTVTRFFYSLLSTNEVSNRRSQNLTSVQKETSKSGMNRTHCHVGPVLLPPLCLPSTHAIKTHDRASIQRSHSTDKSQSPHQSSKYHQQTPCAPRRASCTARPQSPPSPGSGRRRHRPRA